VSAVFQIDGMTCSGCANALRKALARHDASLSVAIDPASGRVTLEQGEPDAAAKGLAAAALDAGFTYRGQIAGA
jgi:copper chaperone